MFRENGVRNVNFVLFFIVTKSYLVYNVNISIEYLNDFSASRQFNTYTSRRTIYAIIFRPRGGGKDAGKRVPRHRARVYFCVPVRGQTRKRYFFQAFQVQKTDITT